MQTLFKLCPITLMTFASDNSVRKIKDEIKKMKR